ncbi:hypothetical protein ACFQ1M_07070 [Sungkyunkwania multivorans]|uniref:Uncharacterized protein n=1 Tax=Sungkyunkwania multivorans TaxID=1173618 RepID=A0ABW3CYQ2_9FLAO
MQENKITTATTEKLKNQRNVYTGLIYVYYALMAIYAAVLFLLFKDSGLQGANIPLAIPFLCLLIFLPILYSSRNAIDKELERREH